MHPIVSERAGWADLVAEKAKLAQAQAAFTQRHVAAENKWRAEKVEYDAELRRLMLDGDLPRHDPPQQPHLAGDPALFIAESQRLAAQEQAWLARHADRFERDLTARHDEVLAEAAALVAGLADCATELASIVTTVAVVRGAAGVAQPVAQGRVDPAALVRAVENGESFLAPPGRRSTTFTGMDGAA